MTPIAALAEKTGATPFGDLVTLVVWTALALASCALVGRQPPGRRGAWSVVALYCTIVAVDKAIDLQGMFYVAVRRVPDLVEQMTGWSGHRGIVRTSMVVIVAAGALLGTLWLVRRDRRLDCPRWLAIGGLLAVLLWVGLRPLLPPDVHDEPIGWAIEAAACLAIAAGLRLGWRRSGAQGPAGEVPGAT